MAQGQTDTSGYTDGWQGYVLWATVAAALLPPLLLQGAPPNGGFYLLAVAGLVAYPARGLHALGKQLAITAAAVVACVGAATGAPQAWAALGGVQQQYLNPVSGAAYAAEVVLIASLWRRLGVEFRLPLFLSLASFLALVHFDLAGGGDEAELAVAVVVLALGLAGAVIAMVRGQLAAGAAALLIGLIFLAKVWGNGVAVGSYDGFWWAEWA